MKKNKRKYPLLIALALLAITGGLISTSKIPWPPSLTLSEAGFNDIVIQARGTNGKEKIALYVNNQPVKFWNLTNTFKDYTYTPNGEITVSQLSIEFLNDTWEPENNINYDVQIPYITVNGTKYSSEHASTVSTGSWDQEDWCAPGNKKTQWLNCTGSFTYNIPVGTVVGVPVVDPEPPVSDVTKMISPAPGSTITQDTTFTWSGKEGRNYDLLVGSTPGGNDYHDRDANYGSKSEEVTDLPATGEKVYVRLTWTDDFWTTFDEESYEYTLPAPNPEPPVSDVTKMISPAPGSTITQDTTFTWSGKEGRNYDLLVGSTPGGNDYHDRDANYGSKSEEVTDLPATGEKVYVRLTWTDDFWTTFDEESYEYTLPAPDPNALTIQSDSLTNITSSTADIAFTASENVQAYTDYGTSTDYGRQTPKELRFNWATHNQKFTGLSPETKYYYRISVTNEAGKTATKTGSFTTLKGSGGGTDPASPVVGWNDDLPYGGRAIGVVTSGISTGNAKITRHKSSRRFMATRSGTVKGFGYHNRILSADDIKSRAVSRRTSQPIWYKIQQAVGNDPKRGGYMLGNSYSVGNGGLQEVTLQTDDGNGFPSGNVIAKAKPYIPFDLPARRWVTLDFISSGNVKAGQIYHLVYENLNPPPELSGLSASEAKNAPTNKGAIALDGTTDGIPLDPSERHGPFLRNFPTTLVKKSASSSWQDTNVTSWYGLVYADGVAVGETYAHFQGVSAYRHAVEGNKQLRQEFTWNYPNVRVDRIATRYGLEADANGRPMNIVMKNQSNSTIASASIPFDQKLKTAAQSSTFSITRQTRHSVQNLSKTVELVKGRKYYIEYSAPSGAGYVMSQSIEDGDATDRNKWKNANGNISTDGGRNWNNFRAFADSDLPIYLIPVGVPTQTPRP